MKAIGVRLGERSYRILVGRDLLSRAGARIKECVKPRQAVIVTQKTVATRYLAPLEASLSREGISSTVFTVPEVPSSEAAKSEAVFSKLIRALAAADGKNRAPFLIALGGGVIGDLTGFAASVYRRGVPYVQIPTTLTSQVDSAIGGKTAIDLPEGKNLLGSIYQPALVLADVSTLSSLPERHWSDGFAEVIKYGVIRDKILFEGLERHGLEGASKSPLLERIIARCAGIKAGVVAKDEFDKKGERVILNFGHTAGHAIEAVAGYSARYTHGEAVGIGMLVACDLGRRMGTLKDPGLTERLEKTLIKFKLPLYYKGLATEKILESMGYDKKAEAGTNRFVLPVTLGKVTVVRGVPGETIAEALRGRKG